MIHRTQTLAKRAVLFGTFAALCALPSVNAGVTLPFSEDFQGDFGNPIFTNSGSQYEVDIRSVANSPFPTSEGSALRIRDKDSNNGPSIEWELNTSISAAAISFDYHIISTSATVAPIVFGIGQATGSTSTSLSSSSSRLATVNLNNEGGALFQAQGTASNPANGSFTLGAVGSINVFINDFDSQSVNYTAPGDTSTSSLAANTVVFYLDGALAGSKSFSDGTLGSNDLGTTVGNIGRFGFNGFSSNEGIVAHFDNLNVSAIPEPGTYALLFGALALGFAVIRRRR